MPPAPQPAKKPSAGPLVTHGLESLVSAVELLGQETLSDRSTRQAIILLAMGAELLVKSRLMAEHWSLVFDKIENANIKKLEEGDLATVGAKQCLQRLENNCQLVLTNETKERLTALWDYRNRIVHFAVATSPSSLRAKAFAALGEIVDFTTTHCVLSNDDMTLLRSVTAGLAVLSEYVTKRNLAIAPQVAALLDGGYYCPSCGQRAVDVNDKGHCLFCREEEQFPGDVWEAHLKGELLYLDKVEADDKNVAVCHTCETPFVIVSRRGATHMRCLFCRIETAQELLRQCVSCRRWVTPPAAGEDFRCPDCPGSYLSVN